MYDFDGIMNHLMKEVSRKDETGIKNQSDLDTLVKLAQIMKDFTKTSYYCTVIEAMEQEEYSHSGGYSERRHRDSMGRYARNGGNSYSYDGSSYGGKPYKNGMSYDNGYSEAKGDLMDARQSYRVSRSPESKRDVMEAAERMKEKFMSEVKELIANADTREERDIYKGMLHGLGNLA